MIPRTTARLSARRPGGALLLAILVLLLIDCVVLGTVQLARLEQRLARNAATALALRLDARSAAEQAVAAWPIDFDTLRAGQRSGEMDIVLRQGTSASAYADALAGGLFLVQARVRGPMPGAAAASSLLVLPPALPPGVEPAPAALSARSLQPASGTITGGGIDCLSSAGLALRVVVPVVAGPLVDGVVVALHPDSSLHLLLPRLAAAATDADSSVVRMHDGDLTLDGSLAGVLLVTGGLRLRSGAAVRGLVIVGGSLVVDAGAGIHGAAHVGAAATVDGLVSLDACEVGRATAAARLEHARPLAHRPVIPAF